VLDVFFTKFLGVFGRSKVLLKMSGVCVIL
jgi:hypothetical protein